MATVIRVEKEEQYKQALEVRRDVFIVEQNVPPNEEIDDLEKDAIHFVAYDDEGYPIGAGRFRINNEKGKVERICVRKSHRGQQIGKLIMDKIEHVALSCRVPTLVLNSQTHAIPFYEKLGYKIISDEFMDAGIPHKTMEKRLDH